MANTARIGSGAVLSMGTAANSLTALDELIALTLPNPQIEEKEATHYGSGGIREYIAGMLNNGDGTFDFNYNAGNATDVAIRAALSDRAIRYYKIAIPDGTTAWEFTGAFIVKGWERSVPMDDRMTAKMTVRFTGAVTEAQGS